MRLSLRAVAESVLQLLMEADVEGLIGAGRHRTGRRSAEPGATAIATAPSTPGLARSIFKILEAGGPAGYFPPFLEARKTTWKRRWSPSIQEAWIGGVSTRRVDEIPPAMALSGISKRQPGLETVQGNRRAREGLPRTAARRRLALSVAGCDLPESAREGGRIVSVAAIIAVAANTEGRREIVGLGIGPSEAETFWADFLEAPDQTRPARSSKLVDLGRAHEGLKAAVQRVVGATWRRTLSRALHA